MARRALVWACSVLLVAVAATVATSPAGHRVPARLTALARAVPAARPNLARRGLVSRGPLPGATNLHLDLVLRPRDPAALSSYASEVSTPGSPLYHHPLSLASFRRRFGATASTVGELRRSLARAGIDNVRIDPDGLVAHVDTTAATAGAAFATQLYRVAATVDGQAVGWTAASAPSLRRSGSRLLAGVVGLDSSPAPRRVSLDVRERASGHGAKGPALAGGGCAAAQYSGLTPPQIAAAYGLDRLRSSGGSPDSASGVSVAVIEFAPFSAADLAAFASCYGLASSQVSRVTVDGGAAPDAQGSIEADLDVEELLGLAPGASISVYEAPNTDAGSMDAFTQAVDSGAKVITSSWGLCEASLDPGVASAENVLFQQAAALGESVIAASGDAGSEDCAASSGDRTSLAVDDPSSQPFVTGVGGTALELSPRSETAWNAGGFAGGGGLSSLWPMPSYQSGGANPAPGVIGAASSGAPCSAAAGSYCREVPDVSANAGTPYGIFATVTQAKLTAGAWVGAEGTSGAAPTWAALLALADASAACAGRSVGFVNPTLYAIAAGAGAAGSLTDVTGASGPANNSTNPAFSQLYPVGPGYDMATGLGTPLAVAPPGAPGTGLVQQLCQGPSAVASGSTSQSARSTASASPGTAPPGAASAGSPASGRAPGSSRHVPPPVIARVRPAQGPPAGGTVVVLKGLRLGHPVAVLFGHLKARLLGRPSSTRLRVVSPPGSGTVSVRVRTAAGTSHTVLTFTYGQRTPAQPTA